MRKLLFILVLIMMGTACKQNLEPKKDGCAYLEFENPADRATGGIRMIPIKTPVGEFNVWTKRVGNNPTKKVLLLHGGPGATHELYECFDGYLPQEGIEYIYYDQLGSHYSDQPTDTSLWTNDRFVEEVEQVRIALGLDNSNFYLLGQSWGGILAIEYALKYQEHLKGLIISNMVSSIPVYNSYAKEVLGPQMPPAVFKEILEIEENADFTNPRYMELLMKHHYAEHILRKPVEQWPESIQRCFNNFNHDVYVYMQGHSEFGITKGATLFDWDRSGDLKKIKTPTLVIAATHDSMDPKHKEWMASEFPNGRFLLCENGSHLAQYDDQKRYFDGLINFIHQVDRKIE